MLQRVTAKFVGGECITNAEKLYNRCVL